MTDIDGNNSSGHLIIDVDVEAPRAESDDNIDAEVGTTFGAGAPNTAGVGAVTSAAGKMAAGACTVGTAGAAVICTAGAGSVTVSGGNCAGGVNTSGAGSVSTYTGVSAMKDNNAEEDFTKKLPWMVGALGGLADSAATAAALFKSPLGVAAHGGEVAYRVGIASVLVAGVVEMVAAFWVRGDTQKRGATGKKILHVSIMTLLLGIALDGVAIVLKK